MGRTLYPFCVAIAMIWVLSVLLPGAVKAQPSTRAATIALMQAIKAGNTDSALLALDQGADPNTKDKETRLSALLLFFQERDEPGKMVLVYPADDARLVEALLKKGARIEARDRDGYTPFLLAAHYGLPRITQLLLDHGARINDRNKQGETALMLAASSSLELVKSLVRQGAKPNLVDREGYPALSYAVSNGYVQTVKYLIDLGLPAQKRKEWLARELKSCLRPRDHGGIYQEKQKIKILQEAIAYAPVGSAAPEAD